MAATNCSIGTQCRAPDTRFSIPRRTVRNILIGLVAAISVSYAEYRAIEQAPGFAAACLVALSSDFKRVIDTNIEKPSNRLEVAY